MEFLHSYTMVICLLISGITEQIIAKSAKNMNTLIDSGEVNFDGQSGNANKEIDQSSNPLHDQHVEHPSGVEFLRVVKREIEINNFEGNQLDNQNGKIDNVNMVNKKNSGNMQINSNTVGGGLVISNDDGGINNTKVVNSGSNAINAINKGMGSINIHRGMITNLAEFLKNGTLDLNGESSDAIRNPVNNGSRWEEWGTWTEDVDSGNLVRRRQCKAGLTCKGITEQYKPNLHGV